MTRQAPCGPVRRWRCLASAALIAATVLALLPMSAVAKHKPADGEAGGGKGWLTLTDGVAKPEPTAQQLKDRLIVFRRSLLERIYASSHPRAEEIVAGPIDLQAARAESETVQIGVYALRDLRNARVAVSELRDDAGHVMPADAITVRMVRYYGVQLAIAKKGVLGVVPKTLEIAVPLSIPRETVRPYWITVTVPAEQAGGTYRGTLKLEHDDGRVAVPIAVEVVPVTLDQPDVLYGTLCVNVLANLWKMRAGRSEGGQVDPRAYLDAADLMFRDQRAHGATMISLRSQSHYEEHDGHPYLADLEAAIGVYKKYGFTQPMIYCAGQLLHTNKINRSDNYKEFDPNVHIAMAKQVAAYYTKRFRDEGLPGIAFMPVEEPNVRSGIGLLDAPDVRRKLATTLFAAMKEAGAKTALTCTPESVTAALDTSDYWIVAYKKFTPSLYELAAQHHAQLGVYANATMMGQGTYFTRFMFGYFTWANGLKGMLPWTYPVQPKRFPVNVGGRGEGGLNVHDEFIGSDGRPIPTIQWELSREGIDDARYLATIERLARRARELHTAAADAAAGEAEALLASVHGSVDHDVRHYSFEDPQTFAPVPQDDWNAGRFDATRSTSFEVLKHLIAAVPAGG